MYILYSTYIKEEMLFMNKLYLREKGGGGSVGGGRGGVCEERLNFKTVNSHVS